MTDLNMLNWYHPCLLDDPDGNHNNHEAVLIDRALYRANAAFLKLEEDIWRRFNDTQRTPYKPITGVY
jgi:hypothetical protein